MDCEVVNSHTQSITVHDFYQLGITLRTSARSYHSGPTIIITSSQVSTGPVMQQWYFAATRTPRLIHKKDAMTSVSFIATNFVFLVNVVIRRLHPF